MFSRRPSTRPQKTVHASVLPGAMVVCSSCGNKVPKGADFCEKCGVPIATITAPSTEDKVYDYIVKHEGIISLSEASAALGISVDQLKETAERLKKEGRLA